MRYWLLALGAALGLVGPVHAQSASPERIGRLQADVAYLASDELAGRGTGTPGGRAAEAFVRDRFDQLGLLPLPGQDDFVHAVTLAGNQPGEIWIETPSGRLNAFSDIGFYGFLGTDGPVTRPLRFVGDGNSAAMARVRAGEVVLVGPGMASAVPILTQAYRAGAAALVYIMPEGREFNIEEAEIRTPDRPFPPDAPVFTLSPAQAAALLRQTRFTEPETGLIGEMTYQVARQTGPVETANVLGMIPGAADPDSFVAIMAHYDHLGSRGGKVFNGANDNASGVAAMLEIARQAAARRDAGHPPARSLVFIALSAEEHGNLGASQLIAEGVIDAGRIAAGLNLEMFGRRDPETAAGDISVYLVGSGLVSSELQARIEALDGQDGAIRRDPRYNQGRELMAMFERSDHWPLAQQGAPVFMMFGGIDADYHATTDDPERLDYDLLAARTGYAALIAFDLADAPAAPARNSPPPDFVRR